MTDKAYIVTNEAQEREVLEVLCANGMKYFDGPSSQFRPLTGFPYVIYESDRSNVLKSGRVPKIKYSTDILYDGRKEEKMSDKYVVSQEFMKELEGWKHDLILEDAFFVNQEAINNMPKIIENWWVDDYETIGESNKRLISIIRYMSGANDFEVEKPKKWVVRSKDSNDVGEHRYLRVTYTFSINHAEAVSDVYATKFDTKEEAESWANSHQEVVEVDE